MLDHSCQVQRHPLTERGHDLYETPPEAVQALLRVERIPHCVWECCAGKGAIVRVLRDAGHAVIASDLIDYGFPLHFVAEFLAMAAAPVGTEAIFTNVPFKLAARCAAKALELCPRVYMLMRLAFYEAGELNNKRLDRHLRALVLDGGKLARIHVFRLRLPMMHRDQWAGKKANSGMAWDANHSGPTTIDRIDWRTPAAGEPEKSPIINKEAIIMARTVKAVKKTEAPAPEENSAPIPKPSGEFDLSKFKAKRAAAVANVETLPSALPVHNFAAAKDFVRFHSNEAEYWSDELCFAEVPIKGQKHNTLHLIDEDLALRFLEAGEIKRFRLALATKPGDVFFLCEVPTQNLDNAWNISNLEACEKAKTLWTKVTSRKGEGVESYKITYARDPQSFSDPKWPTQSLAELIARAFAGRMIETEDHPALLRKIGAKQSLS
jgi:hypothetical protein